MTTNPLDIPKVVWISGLGNPTSFLTIKQVTAQKDKLELDKLVIQTDVSRRCRLMILKSQQGMGIRKWLLHGGHGDVGVKLSINHNRRKCMFKCQLSPAVCSGR